MAATVLYDSIVTGTLAEILARSGLHTYQRAVATDFNDCELYWNGSAWRWAKKWQPLAKFRTAVTAPTDLNENVLATFTLPALAANDMLMVKHFWTTVNNANAKTAKVNLGATGAGTGWSCDLASAAVHNMVTEIRNMNDTAVQKWQSNNKAIFGSTTGGALQGTTRALGTAGVTLAIAMLKGTGADSVILEWADFWICGT